MALGCLFKPTIVAYPLVIFIVWINNRYKLKEMVRYASIVFGIFCILILPWWIRNYNDFKMFIPFTESSGNPFYWDKILGMNYYWARAEHYFILIAAIIGIANNVKVKKWNLEKQIIILSIIVMNVVYLPYFTFCRYSYPLMCLMSIFSGDFIYRKMYKYRALKARKGRDL